jgi:membrane-anchored protein YejM (alkaline phosphatase superfamily)
LGYYATGLLILPLVLSPLFLTRPTRFLPVILYWGWLLYLIANTFVFITYSHHLNPWILRIVILDFSGLGVSPPLLVVFALLAAALMVVLILVYRRLERKNGGWKPIKLHTTALVASLGLFTLNSFIHIWANAHSREEILLYNGFLPLYRPFTSHALAPRLSQWLPGFFPPDSGQGPDLRVRSSYKLAHYPLQELEFKSPPQSSTEETIGSEGDRASIVFIVLESWQSTTFSPEITPNLWDFAQGATHFRNHISSGSATVTGLFGLMYGTHPTLYDSLKNAPISYPSIFTEALHRQGYEARVFSGNNFERFQLRTLFFSKVKPENYHFSHSDEVLVENYLDTLDQGRNPRFDFIFLVASHWPYSYPPAFGRFQPTPAIKGSHLLNHHTDPKPYLNAYYNSLAYLDSLVGKIIRTLKERGLYENTWIVVTGDHAEEFNENAQGYWGHGSNFSRWQTATPLLMKRPGQNQGKVEERRSFHQDVVPTLMEENLGCLTEAKAYSDGQNLYRLPDGVRSTIVSSYFDTAYILGDTVMEKLRMKRYSWSDMKPLAKSPSEEVWLRAMLKEERRFITATSTSR